MIKAKIVKQHLEKDKTVVSERVDKAGREANEAAASGFEIASSVHDQARLADMAGNDCIDVIIRTMASP